MLFCVKTFVCLKSFFVPLHPWSSPHDLASFIMIDMKGFEKVSYECELRYPNGQTIKLQRFSVEALLAHIKTMHIACSAMVLESVSVRGVRATLLFSAVVCGLDLEG